MKKTRSKKLVLSLLLALVLALGLATPVLAAPGDAYGNEAEAVITKIFKMPAGVTSPTAEFTFNVTAVSLDADTTPALVATMPSAGTMKASFSDALTGSSNDISSSTSNTDDKIFYRDVEIFDEDADSSTDFWPRAGVYQYFITESATYTVSPALDPNKETLTTATNSYDMWVYVDNGPVTGQTYAELFIVVPGGATPATAAPTGMVPSKADATPNQNGNGGLRFVNTYSKTNGGIVTPPTDPGDLNGLNISKVVTGQSADQTKYFDYTMTVTQPSVLPASPVQKYRAYVVQHSTDTVVSDITPNYSGTVETDTNNNKYFEVTSNVAVSFKLKHDQRIAFAGIHVGATYTSLTEVAPGVKWTPSAVQDFGDTSIADKSYAGTENTALTVDTALVGEDLPNSVAFTNTYTGTTLPTGLDINDLPFVLMLVLAAGALVAFVIVRYRKKARAGNR